MGKSFICGEVIYVWGSHSLIQGGKKLCPKICGEVGMGKSTSGEDCDTPITSVRTLLTLQDSDRISFSVFSNFFSTGFDNFIF